MTPDLFTHHYEDTKANTAILNSQKERLSVNAWIILYCLLEGQHLSAINFVTGIQFDGMLIPKQLCEYRRRLCELRDNGIDIMFEVDKNNGCKLHWIPQFKRAELIAKYEPFKTDLLTKINKRK